MQYPCGELYFQQVINNNDDFFFFTDTKHIENTFSACIPGQQMAITKNTIQKRICNIIACTMNRQIETVLYAHSIDSPYSQMLDTYINERKHPISPTCFIYTQKE